jgi:thioredoxin-dependent peroxiredoxin
MATVLTSSIPATNELAKKGKSKIKENQQLPEFQFVDVLGKNYFMSDLKGKKILLTFYRNVGCPVCNLRFHELEKETDYFRANNIILLSIYESPASVIENFISGQEYYTLFIPDPEEKIYNLFSLEKSYGKMMKGIFNGAMRKVKKGKSLFKKEIRQDGNLNRIGADFLIDENGKVLLSHYHKYLADDLPIEAIKKKVQETENE